MEARRGNSLLEAQGCTKTVWVMILVIGFLAVLPLSSAENWEGATTEGLIAWYEFDNSYNDSTGKWNLSVAGFINFTPSNFGYAALFNSSGSTYSEDIKDYLFNGTVGLLDDNSLTFIPNQTLGTIEAVVKLNDTTSNKFIYSFSSFVANNGLRFYINATAFSCWTPRLPNNLELSSFNYDWKNNTLYHLTCSWNGTGINTYLNGILKSTNLKTVSDYPGYNGYSIGIFAGKIGESTEMGFRFNGTIDDIRIYNLTRTGNEIFMDYLDFALETYNNQTLEVSSEYFAINISYDSTYYPSISGTLIYNNTEYSGSKSGSGDNIIYSRTLTTPSVSADTNITFYWRFGLTNATSTYYYNSTFHNQSVRNLALDNCTSGTILLFNLTLKDEESQNILSGSDMAIDVDLLMASTADTSFYLNLSFNRTGINPVRICIDENLSSSSYRMDAQIRYSTSSHAKEFYHLQNFTITNATIPQHINLYDLNNSDSTTFLITYKDTSFLPVENAIINMKRKYISEGLFKTIEAPKTDAYGQTRGHFDTDGVMYSITVMKEGQILSVFDNIAVFCEDIVIGKCKINLYGSSVEDTLVDYYTYHGLSYSLTFNETLRQVILSFQTLDNSVSFIQLNLTKFDGFGNVSLCSESVPSSSGTLTCPIASSYGNLSFFAEVYRGSNLVTTRSYTIRGITKGEYEGNLVIFILILFLTLPLMLLPSSIGSLIGGGIGLAIGIILLGLSSFGLIATGSFFVWFVIATVIVIWKISGRGGE